VTDVKFCGLTRAEDAAFAAELGARYVGAIFAGGPRTLSVDEGRKVLAERGEAKAVGVFATDDIALIERVAESVKLDVIQLHNDPGATFVAGVKEQVGRPVWAVVRVRESDLPDSTRELFEIADGVLLDTSSDNGLGGTGRTFDWNVTATRLDRIRGSARVILAGGLNAENVAVAIASLSPEVVDVSSGVETAPGIKDHERMRRFASATRAAGSAVR
jgi:phosphoribosylanthranilate isomerase